MGLTNKVIFLDAVSSYHLNGLVEKTKWKVKNKKLHIAFKNEPGDLTGELFLPLKLKDGDYNIYETSKLVKLLSILQGADGDIVIEPQYVEGNNDFINSLIIADNKIDIKFNLCSPRVVEGYWFNSGKVQDLEYQVEAELDEEFITTFIKSAGALGSNEEFLTLTTNKALGGDNELCFTLGDKKSNQIKFSLQCNLKEIKELESLKFSIESFKQILSLNKEFDRGILKINSRGLCKFEIKRGELELYYYIVIKK